MPPKKTNVTVSLIEGDADRATREMILTTIPALRATSDDEMADALYELYRLGAQVAAKSAEEVLQELGDLITKLVVAHQRQDTQQIVSILDDFVVRDASSRAAPARPRPINRLARWPRYRGAIQQAD